MVRGDVVSPGDAACRATLGTHSASDTLVGIDVVLHEVLADVGGTLLVHDVCDVLIPEVGDCGVDRVRRGLTQGAEGVRLDRVGQLLELVQVLHGSLAFGDAGEDLKHALGSDAARCALSAGLVADELHVELGHVDHTVVLVHDDGSAGTHHGSLGNEVVEVDRLVEVLGSQTSARRSACLDGLELLAAGDSSADVVDQLPEGCSHRDLDQSDVVDLAAECEDLGSLGLLGSDRCECLGTVAHDVRDTCQGLDVVDDGRLAPQSLDCREWRSGPGHSALAFDGVQQGCLLTADECSCTESEMAAEAEVCSQDVVAQKTDLLGLPDCDPQSLDCDGILGSDIEITVLCTDRVTGDDHSLDDRKGISLEDRAVHECARVTFVTVADDVLLIARRVECELPLASGRESAAAPSSETAGQDLVHDILLAHGKCLLQTLETTHSEALVDVLGIDDSASVECDTALLLVEVDLILLDDLLLGCRIDVEQALHDLAVPDILLDDLLDILDLDESVECVFRVDLDEGSLRAETETSYQVDRGLVLESLRLQKLLELGLDLIGMA